MNRNFPAYQQDEGLRRIAVLLINLAVLAEMAALRSWPVRCLMLWLLRPAETAARNFATDCGYVEAPLVHADGPDIDPNGGSSICLADGLGDGIDEASRLAWIFRALAAFFFYLSCEAAHLICAAGRQAVDYLPIGGLKAIWLHSLFPALRPGYADTS